MRPVREDIDVNVVQFPPESAFSLWCIKDERNFLYLYLNLACKQICFPPGMSSNMRNKNTKVQHISVFLCSDDNIQYSWLPTLFYHKSVKTQIDFPYWKDNQLIFTDLYFSRTKWQLWGIGENWQLLTRRIARSTVGVTWHKTRMLPDHK